MRHRHGLTLLNLLFEQRNNAPVAAEHVPEAGTDKFCGARLLLRQVLHNHFAAALGGAHHVRGVHRLVGRDHHELFHLVEQRKERDIEGARHIVLDSLHRATFHQGHMLVGRRMEHHVGLVFFEDSVHALVVAHACNERHQVQRIAVFHHHFLLDFVGIVFVDVDYDQLLGVVLCNLAHQFRANRAAATCHQANLPFDEPANVLVVERDRFSPQKVFDLDVANDARKAHPLLGVKGIAQGRTDERQHLHGEPRLVADVQNDATVLGRATRNGKNDLLHGFGLCNLFDFAGATRHQDTAEHAANLAVVIVYHADGQNLGARRGLFALFVGTQPAVRNFGQEQLACSARPDNHGTLERGIFAARIDKNHEGVLDQVSKGTYTANGQGAGQRRKAAIHGMGKDIVQDICQDIAHDHALDAAQIVFAVKVAPKPVVGPKEQKARKAADYTCRQKGEQVGATYARRISRNREIS